jgi:hypothetical protein
MTRGDVSTSAQSPSRLEAIATPRRISRLASRFPCAVDPAECRAWALRVALARDEWTANFGGVQYTLGRAWYTHLEEDREDEYFAAAEASDALVERVLPGFQAHLLAMAGNIVGCPVERRRGYCGPGVHVFPAGSEVARRGGEPHFDTEGLSAEHLAERAPALTLVLMLQPPSEGGGTAVWDCTYAGEDFAGRPARAVLSESVEYKVGDLMVIDSYRLHQILPFEGTVDRISATMHLVQEGDAWVAWF